MVLEAIDANILFVILFDYVIKSLFLNIEVAKKN